MTITYDWIFNPLTVKPAEGSLTDVVITVDWRRTAVDAEYGSSTYGQVSLGPPDPSDFTEFSDLTKSQVENWVVGVLTQPVVDEYNISLSRQIENQKHPQTLQLTPPWSATMLIGTDVPTSNT